MDEDSSDFDQFAAEFGKDPFEPLLPLDRDRIKKVLEKHNWSYQVNHEGDIGGAWQHGTYFFQVTGENDSIFCVRGTWSGQADLDDFLLISSLCNRWNTDYYWPKAYTRVTDEREVFVHTELPISYRQGLSDFQLDEHIRCALESSEDFFENLSKKFAEKEAPETDSDSETEEDDEKPGDSF